MLILRVSKKTNVELCVSKVLLTPNKFLYPALLELNNEKWK